MAQAVVVGDAGWLVYLGLGEADVARRALAELGDELSGANKMVLLCVQSGSGRKVEGKGRST